MKKRIVLCADDYGQALTISQGIINLIKQSRLSATSCIVNTSHWTHHAQWLLPYQHHIDIGLHFNLTDGQALSQDYINKHGGHFFTLPTLMRKAFFSQLDKTAIEAECHAQIDSFCDHLGFLPHYLDGHQHVHQFPIIRQAVIAVYEKRLRPQQAYIRLINEPIKLRHLFFDIKKMIIKFTGTAAFGKLLEKNKIPHNQSLAGIYAFTHSGCYAQLFTSFLRSVTDKGLIFCHPGLASPESLDSLAKTRYDEYQYLASSQFLDDCKAQGVVLQRFREHSQS